ncbi:hypothetical protein ANO14919_039960 [Xylariales sp. No.14919]|nr:hypothetical protein ANO14919_039960 [Xylariales sp. No.14919]
MRPPHPDLLVQGRGHAQLEDQLEASTADDQTPRSSTAIYAVATPDRRGNGNDDGNGEWTDALTD